MTAIRPWISPPGPYAGIGSRRAPADVLALMTTIARALAARGFILRSGGAVGADRAFEQGAVSKEIFWPWSDFGWPGEIFYRNPPTLAWPTLEAFDLAAKYHPTWSKLSASAKKLMARNGHQVLGADLATPARFLLCWTPDGATDRTTTETGGTGQAIRIAVAYKIPVWNLARGDHRKIWEELT